MPSDLLEQLTALQADVVSFFCAGGTVGMSLFEISCSGKPELTLQGELLYYLRTAGWKCVQEAGYSAESGAIGKRDKRNIDILVFDKNATASHSSKPICCIELKHFSSNQGGANKLTIDLDNDFLRPRPGCPIMQVAMYTTIETFTMKPAAVGLHRFARAICGKSKAKDFETVFSSWWRGKGSKKWACIPGICSAPAVPINTFSLQTGETLSGWVEAFVGIRT